MFIPEREIKNPIEFARVCKQNRANFAKYSPDVCHEKGYGNGLLAYDKKDGIPDYENVLRKKLIEILGDEPQSCPFNAREEYCKEFASHTETRVVIETEKDCFCPVLLLRPKGIIDPQTVVCLQGHSPGMQLSVGRPYRLKDGRKIRENRDFALEALRRGYAAVVIEQRCFGERKSRIKGDMCAFTSANALLVGRTMIGERVWDVRRVIDYLETRDDFSAEKVGIVGTSGGGTAAYYAACIDDRIEVAMPGCSVCSFYGSIGTKHHCACNYLPGAAKYFDMGDLATLICPKKLVIVAGIHDPLFPYADVKKAYETIRKIYAEKGFSDNVALFLGNGKHRFYRGGWDLFDRFFGGAKRLRIADKELINPIKFVRECQRNKVSISRYSPDVCHEKLFGKGLLAYDKKDGIADYEKVLRAKLTEVLGDTPEKKERKAWEEYRREYPEYTETRVVIETEKDCFCPVLILLPKGVQKPPVVLCLQGHSPGMQISVARPYYKEDKGFRENNRDFCLETLRRGYAAVAIEQRGFGERRSRVKGAVMCAHTAQNALLVGRTLIGERVWDVSRVIDYLETRGDVDCEKIGLMGNSGGGTATYYTACMEERIKIAMPGCSVCTYLGSIGTKHHCACNYLPGAAKYFDMGDLATLIAPRRLVLVAGSEDPIFPYEDVLTTFETIKSIYKDKGAEGNAVLFRGEGGHRFYYGGFDLFDRFAKELGW